MENTFIDQSSQAPIEKVESNNHRGFPSAEEEKKLKTEFDQNYRDKAQNFLKDKQPQVDLTKNQLDYFLNILYGIYFFNRVTDGKVITQNIDELASWPIEIVTQNPHDFVVAAQLTEGQIHINISKLPDENHEENYSITARFDRSDMSKYVFYYTNPKIESILGGIEEAMHIYTAKLERIHYGATGKQEVPVGPIRTIKHGADVIAEYEHRIGSSHGASVDYHSLDGFEYMAHIVTMEYIRRYMPSTWEHDGFKRFHQAVMENRKAILKNPLPRSLARKIFDLFRRNPKAA